MQKGQKQTIYVLRHGQDRDNANRILNGSRNMPLTGLGRRQASSAGSRLKGKGITRVYASPQNRAKTTARKAMGQLGIPAWHLRIHHGLKERECGSLSGRRHKDINALPMKMFRCKNGIRIIESAPGSETLQAVYRRAQKTLAELEKLHPDETLLLVTHGHTGMMLRAAYYNLGWRKVFVGSWRFKNATFFELGGDSPAPPFGK